jgi:RimJ/RimL family protein N-acetyltransferase
VAEGGAGVTLRPWGPDDLSLLVRHNTPQMMRHLGGPETVQRLTERHEKYLRLNATGEAHMFAILAAGEPEPVGEIGYWQTEWEGRPTWDAGWMVATGYQRRGYAGAALAALLRDAAGRDPERHLVYADPLVGNEASNRLCARLGFVLRGERDVEHRPGNLIRVNVWVFDLRQLV